MSIIFYKRPDYISRPDGPLNKTECARYVEKYKHLQGRTPSELSFENVIENRTLPPCTLNDFMDYLVYVERNAENLQFYLWLRDYTTRFNALPDGERELSPEWEESDQPSHDLLPVKPTKQPFDEPQEDNFDRGSADINRALGHAAWPLTTASLADGVSSTTAHTKTNTTKTTTTFTEDANASAWSKLDAFGKQPFREDVMRAVAHYIAPDSPRELNISHRDRDAVLYALQHTTHPSAFASINRMVESILKGQAHPNFVRWSVCNGNRPKVLFVRTMGTTMVLLSLLAMTVLVLSRAPRWYRIIPCILLWFGTTNLVASKKGMCMILTFNHQRDLKPWELDADPASTFGIVCKPAPGSSKSAKSIVTITEADVGLHTSDDELTPIGDQAVNHWPLDSFGSSNKWDHKEWVGRYSKRSMLRRAFPGSTWVQAEGIRQLQSHIVRESQLWGLLITVVVVAGFTAIPNGNLY